MTLCKRPTVLTLAATDSAGMAGVAMDVRTQAALGVHSATIITATTAQNNHKVYAMNPVAQQALEDQYAAVSQMPAKVIKMGLLASAEQVQWAAALVATKIHAQQDFFTLVDPVLASSSGADFSADTLSAYNHHLLPHCDLLTPNINEAEQLSARAIETPAAVEAAARHLLACGVGAVLIKGGHAVFDADNTRVYDYFCSEKHAFWLSSAKIHTHNTRGTGCALASAIAAAVALGYALADAVLIGKMAINQGLRNAYAVADSNNAQQHKGPVAIASFPDDPEDLPRLHHRFTAVDSVSAFPPCNHPPLGLYPVVDRASWIPRLAKAGVTTIQLRVKDLVGDALADEIKAAVAAAQTYQCRLFINDYWAQAIEAGAYGVHLGQEDLDSADTAAIKAAGLRLGISTHCHYEVARAQAYQPSYIACGPVYPTQTKIMPWVPQGIAGLHYWRKVLRCPLVAIGGINGERIAAVAATGVEGVAMITAITLADNPEHTAAEFTAMIRRATYD
ncbi:MAG: thiamine phosphate synthase [Cellvibrionaceae bacterium]|nr:thiamine phosphate synthase [Cellvibrionaceae bacterium]